MKYETDREFARMIENGFFCCLACLAILDLVSINSRYHRDKKRLLTN